MNTPKISIIVPCYNQAQYLDECLQSVLDQTYQNWECIIVNDGSPDNTEEVAKKWVAKDSRFKYLHKENGGLSSARNAGIENALGDWILPLDCDDKIASNYLGLASAQFSEGYTVIYCRGQFFGGAKGEFAVKPFSLHNLAQGNMIFCSAFFRKSDWREVGGYDDNMKYGYEDWEFWVNLLSRKPKVYKINEFCFFYRKKNNSMVEKIAANEEKTTYSLRYVFGKHTDFFYHSFIQLKNDNEKLIKENSELKARLKDSVLAKTIIAVKRLLQKND